MLGIDPVVVSKSYAKPVESQSADRMIAIKSLDGSKAKTQRNFSDYLDLSTKAQNHLQRIGDAKSDAIFPSERRESQVRAQVLNFLLFQGLPLDQALTQTERIVARITYHRSSDGMFRGDDGSSKDNQGRPAPKSKSNLKPAITMPSLSGIDILV